MANKDSLILNLTATNDKLKYKLDEAKAEIIKLKEIANKQKIKLAGDNAELQSKLKESQDSLKELQKKAKDSGGGFDILQGAAGKALGVLGGGAAIIATVNTALRANTETANEMDSALNAVETTTQSFFKALQNGNFSSFIGGLDKIITRSRDAYESMLQMQLIGKIDNADYIALNKEKSQYESVLDNDHSSKKEKESALKGLDDVANRYSRLASTNLEKSLGNIDAQILMMLSKASLFDINPQEVIKAITGGNFSKSLDEYKRLQGIIDSGTTTERTQTMVGGEIISAERTIMTDEAKEALKSKDYQMLKAMFNDIPALDTIIDAIREKDDFAEQVAGQLSSISGSQRGGTDDIADGLYFGGAKYNERYSKKVDTGVTTSNITKEIAPIEGSINWYTEELKKLNKLLNAETDSEELNVLREKIKSYQETIRLLRDGDSSSGEEKPQNKYNTSDLDAYRDPPPPILGTESEQQSNLNYVSALSSALSSLGGSIGGASGSWMQYGSTILSMVPQLVAQIGVLAGAQWSLALAGSAAVGGPFGIISLIAMTGAMIASVASIPKFANGGIVSGSSFYGDNVLARVNSGEMILNKGQQNNLFNMINGGNNKSSVGSSQVVFEIKGDKLLGVLNNTKNKRR